MDDAGVGMALIFMVVIFVGYFLPALIAGIRGRDGQNMILLLNLLLGWTVIGWFVLLVLAFTGETSAARKHREEQLSLLRQMAAKSDTTQA